MVSSLCVADAKQDLLEVQTQMELQDRESHSLKDKLEQMTQERAKLTKSNKQLEEDLEETREKLQESMLLTSQLSADVRGHCNKISLL